MAQITHIPEPTFRVVAESDWANAWKEHYHVVHLGERFVIKPTWREYAAQPGEIVMELDPGMAFGTGLHPTTQMCLAAIEKIARPEMRTLDLGTGSGILAIGAALLGVKSITGIDNWVWVSAARTWAGMSSGPSRVCSKMSSPSGTRRPRNRSRSRCTAGSAFS